MRHKNSIDNRTVDFRVEKLNTNTNTPTTDITRMHECFSNLPYEYIRMCSGGCVVCACDLIMGIWSFGPPRKKHAIMGTNTQPNKKHFYPSVTNTTAESDISSSSRSSRRSHSRTVKLSFHSCTHSLTHSLIRSLFVWTMWKHQIWIRCAPVFRRSLVFTLTLTHICVHWNGIG